SPGMGDRRVRRVPGNRLVLDVHDLVMGVEQLDAMAVRVAHIDVHRMPRPMPPRTALDAGPIAEFTRDVAGMQQVMDLRREEGKMMQARTRAVEENDVMRIALALQKHAAQVERTRWRDIFAQ